MKRFFKIFGITLASIIGLVIIAALVACYVVFTPERLTPIVRNVAKEYILTEHEIGEVDLTVFSTFPKVGLRAKGLYIINPMDGAPTDTVLAAPEVVAKIDVMQFLNHNTLDISEVQIKNADACMYINANGESNIDIFPKSDTTETDTSAFSLPFDELKIGGLKVSANRLRFVDEKDTISADINDVKLSGSAKSFDDINLALNLKKGAVVFKQFGFIMSGSVCLSTLSALTICPALCALLFKPKNENKKERKGVNYYVKQAYNVAFNALSTKYIKGVSKFIKRPAYSWILLVIFSLGMVWLMKTAQSELVPQEDQGFFFVDVQTAPGTYLNETETAVNKVQDYINTIDDVELLSGVSGYSIMNGGAGTNYGTLMVRLKNWSERDFYSVATVVNQITMWAYENMPEADVTAFQMPQIPGYGSGSAIELNLQNSSSDDDATFIKYASEFTQKLNERPEVMMAIASYSDNYPKYSLTVDVPACKSKGVSPQTVVETIGTNLAGSFIGTYTKYGKVYYVIVEAGNEYRMEPSTLNNIYVQAGDAMTPVSELVTLTPIMGTSQERRFNLFTCYNLSVITAPGYTSSHVRTAVDEVMAEVFPEGYSYEFGGMAREEAANAGSNTTAIIYAIAVLLVYLILAVLYNSVFIPFAVLLSIPFGIFGAYLSVRPLETLMGVGVNVYVQVGVIMLMGLAAKTAILITEFAVQKRKEGLSIYDAAVGACQDRLRPILMTVLTMIIGMIPLITGNGAGAVGNKALAIAVVGGMTVAIIAILFVTPALYIVFQKIHERLTPDKDESLELRVES